MPDQMEATKELNGSMLFLSIVVTIATIASISISVIQLPPEKMGTGLMIEGILIVLIVISGIITKKWMK
jgi:hypothetical protein